MLGLALRIQNHSSRPCRTPASFSIKLRKLASIFQYLMLEADSVRTPLSILQRPSAALSTFTFRRTSGSSQSQVDTTLHRHLHLLQTSSPVATLCWKPPMLI